MTMDNRLIPTETMKTIVTNSAEFKAIGKIRMASNLTFCEVSAQEYSAVELLSLITNKVLFSADECAEGWRLAINNEAIINIQEGE